MIKEIRYKGPLISDTTIPGERKADGAIPAHPGSGCIPLSRNRWIIFFATLDPRGWDSNRSIIYQLRADAPDGPVLKEDILASCMNNWDPLQRGDRFFKSYGMPIAFGVPKGALRHGKLLPNANRFVVKWYRYAQNIAQGKLLSPTHHRALWPEGLDIRNRTLRVEWAQFQLNHTETDIEILSPPQMMRQRGCDTGPAFCPFGENVFMNHSMKSPFPTDNTCSEWMEFDTFVNYSDQTDIEHGAVAPVRFTFNQFTRLYEWTETGPLIHIPGRIIGESSVNRCGDLWYIALRSFRPDGATCWFRSADPFHHLGTPTIVPNGPTPRMAFLCPDDTLRLFTNDKPLSPYPTERSPLCCWDVHPETFSLTHRHVILDARKTALPFHHPFIDMAKLCPNQGARQLLMYRVITRRQTADVDRERPITPQEHAQAGIYYSEIIYHEDLPNPWQFAAPIPRKIRESLLSPTRDVSLPRLAATEPSNE